MKRIHNPQNQKRKSNYKHKTTRHIILTTNSITYEPEKNVANLNIKSITNASKTVTN